MWPDQTKPSLAHQYKTFPSFTSNHSAGYLQMLQCFGELWWLRLRSAST